MKILHYLDYQLTCENAACTESEDIEFDDDGDFDCESFDESDFEEVEVSPHTVSQKAVGERLQLALVLLVSV